MTKPIRLDLTRGALAVVAATCAALSAAGAQGTPAAGSSAAQQIAGAVLPLPKEMRDGATVLGTVGDQKFAVLRQGTNDMICLASDPAQAQFHASCYHNALEPFMARGRELRAQGKGQGAIDSVRFAEIASGRIKMPTQGALYQIFGSGFDPATGQVAGARSLYVVYIPFATPKSTGLSAAPQQGAPWIMLPGTAKAHIMFTPSM